MMTVIALTTTEEHFFRRTAGRDHYKGLDFEKPIEEIFPNCDFQNFTNNLLFISLIYSENLMYLS